MAKAKLGIGQEDINRVFSSYNEACDYAKRLKQFIYDICKKKANKGWMAQAMIVISNTKRDSVHIEYVNGKARLIENDIVIDKIYKGAYKTGWHIHILIVSKPSVAFRQAIKKYIDKNWYKVPRRYEVEDFDINDLKKSVYKKYCNINMAKYFIEQSAERWFCNYNFSEEEGIKYGLDTYFREYMKLDKARRLAYKKYYKYYNENRLIRDLEKAESKFKEIESYYYSITEVEDMKMVNKYLDNVERNNKKKFSNNVKKVHDLQKILSYDKDDFDLFAGW